jgi:acetylornithine/N-succinyldiaminopimelate aminotransferase
MQYRPKAMSDSSFGKGVGDGVTLVALDLGREIGPRVVELAREASVLVNSPRAGVLRFVTALNAGRGEIDELMGVLGEAVGLSRA